MFVRRCLLSLTLAVAGAVAALLVSAGAAAAAAPCGAQGSRTLEKNAFMRVYKVTSGSGEAEVTRVYGCLYKQNRAVLIDKTNDPFGFSLEPLVLTRGLYVGFSDNEGGGDSSFSIVRLYNLRTGASKLSTPTTFDGSEVSGMVVNGKGSMAWLENDGDTPPAVPSVVKAFDSSGQRTLDTSFGIATNSLQMSADGLTVSWLDNGVQKAAGVSP